VKAVLQRVTQASVRVQGETVGRIGPGLLVLLGVAQGDSRDDAARLAKKAAELRIFNDAEGRFHYSLLDTGGAALVVSQFTLLADARRGRRPSFTEAAPPDVASPLCEEFATVLRALGVTVETGRFGAAMAVELVNDGPVTILLDSRDR
jgi:D-tyrosyl-tRNA(Tyr) deacylase